MYSLGVSPTTKNYTIAAVGRQYGGEECGMWNSECGMGGISLGSSAQVSPAVDKLPALTLNSEFCIPNSEFELPHQHAFAEIFEIETGRHGIFLRNQPLFDAL